MRRALGAIWAVGMLLGALAASGGALPVHAAEPESEAAALQRRLEAAGCYAGPIDGHPSQAFTDAVAACPDQKPQLRIETGTHSAGINDLAVDAACTRAVTASDDKTVRVWSLPDGRLQRVIRPPSGNGNLGKLYAVDLSPDGRSVAVGGWLSDDENKETAELFPLDGSTPRRFGPLTDVVDSVAFSPDGRRLAVGIGSTGGLRVFDLASGNEMSRDLDYADSINGLAFARDGQLFAASEDGFLRTYRPDLQRNAKVRTSGNDPFRIALSPDETRLAVGFGFEDEPHVDILSALDLSRRRKLRPRGGLNGSLLSVAWPDNRSVIAGGTYPLAKQIMMLHWTEAGTALGNGVPIGDDNIQQLKRCGDRIAFVTKLPDFGVTPTDGPPILLGRSAAPDMRGKLGDALRVSPDGRIVRFALGENDDEPVVFDLSRYALLDAARVATSATPLRARTVGLPVQEWEDGKHPSFGTRRLSWTKYDVARSLTIRHDGTGFFLGASFGLYSYDAQGYDIDSGTNMPAEVWGLALDASDNILVAAVGDGTIRWYRTTDRTELLALFVDRRDRRWVAWTPGGYYAASSGGEDLIGWQLNRGWSEEAEFFPASLFRNRFYRPDVVGRVLTTLDEAAAVEQADAERAKSAPAGAPAVQVAAGTLSAIAADLPPQALIVSPANGSVFDKSDFDLTFRIRPAPGRPVDLVQILVDGRVRVAQRTRDMRDDEITVTLADLPPKNLTVEVRPASGNLVGQAARVQLTYQGPKPPDPRKPDLYVVAIGIDDYANAKEFSKTYATVDVNDFVATLRGQEGYQFGHVNVRTLDGETANFQNLRSIFDDLGAVRDDDIVILYLAGHGYVEADQKFRFMLRAGDIGRLNGTSLSARDLLEPLADVRGKKMLLLESCHSGGAADVERANYNMADALNDFGAEARRGPSNLVIMSASQNFENARFDASWKNRGAFTQALIEAFGGAGRAGRGDRLSLLEMFRYVQDRVAALTDQKQHPDIWPAPKDISDFPVALTAR